PNPLTWFDPLGLAPYDVLRMRHYTNARGKEGILSSGVVKAGDQNKIFLVPAKGKPLSPRDAEERLGISRGHGRHVLDFDVAADRISKEYNPIMKIHEWAVTGDIAVTDIKVVR
ncbi:HYD1 signature containing ADP-ribosyltransferase family protein, partial [Frankia sp. Cj3]